MHTSVTHGPFTERAHAMDELDQNLLEAWGGSLKHFGVTRLKFGGGCAEKFSDKSCICDTSVRTNVTHGLCIEAVFFVLPRQRFLSREKSVAKTCPTFLAGSGASGSLTNG